MYYLFLLLNFFIGFFSDIVLNHLSNYRFMKLNTLRPYFDHHSTFVAALYAAITVLIVVLIICNLFHIRYKKYLPETRTEYLVFFTVTFVIGFIADIVIHRLNIFPKLKLYYRVIGSGLWGGLAILFSVAISICIQKIYYSIASK
mgnify:FL=1